MLNTGITSEFDSSQAKHHQPYCLLRGRQCVKFAYRCLQGASDRLHSRKELTCGACILQHSVLVLPYPVIILADLLVR